MRSALVNWGYNTKQRAGAPRDVEDILTWLARNTRETRELADPALCRQLLSAATTRLDGIRAASTSVRRNRAVLLNALEYAVEHRGLKHRAEGESRTVPCPPALTKLLRDHLTGFGGARPTRSSEACRVAR